MSADDRLIAARYVEALFALASEAKQHDAVKADMLALKAAVQGSEEFRKLLMSPVLGRDESGQAIEKILSTLKASELTQKFFALLARNRRLSVAPLAIDAYLARLSESRNELTVDVTAAHDLSSEESKELADAIAKATAKKVAIRAFKNPALLGGLQVRIGSRMLDTSIAGKLARLKQSLTSAA